MDSSPIYINRPVYKGQVVGLTDCLEKVGEKEDFENE